MSFNFDEFKGGGSYLTEDEKKALASSKQVFAIKSVEFQEGQGYEGKDRFLVTIELADEEKLLSFQHGSVESRDEMLAKLSKHVAENGPEYATLKKAGRAFLFEGAESPAASF